ncbi:helix-turn-helix transcriptional regulator [Methylopila musalis]|uniref:Helix-turn-helix transcriptional regulator n=1 Tax=Methylopila musalis TaxID=1134781 RepID=A0ABW3Z4E7_9HYPH
MGKMEPLSPTVERLTLATTRILAAAPRGLRRDDAAAYIGVSPSKFDALVSDGRMPQPFRIDGCVVWDLRKLDMAFDALSDDAPRKRLPWGQ